MKKEENLNQLDKPGIDRLMRVASLFSNRNFLSFIFVLIMLAGAFNELTRVYNQGWVNHDEAHQVLEMYSILEGNGFTTPITFPNDLSKVEFIPLTRFPQGYSAFLAMQYSFTKNPGTADFLSDAFAIILFFVAWFYIFEFTEPFLGKAPRLLTGIFWIVFPAALRSGAISRHTTEGLSIALTSAGVALCMAIFKRPRYSVFFGAAAGLMSGLALTMRTVYLPLIIATPLTLAYMAWLDKENRRAVIYAACANIIVSGLFAAVISYQNWSLTGHITGYIVNELGGISPRFQYAASTQWSHLLLTTPFLGFIFGFADPSILKAGTTTVTFNPSFVLSTNIAWALFFVLLLAYLYACFHVLRVSMNNRGVITGESERTSQKASSVLFLSGVLIFSLTFGPLALLSIAMEKHPFAGGWVPVMELRYFTPIFSFVFFAVMYTVSVVLSKLNNRWVAAAFYLLYAFVLVSSIPTFIPTSRDYRTFVTMQKPPLATQLYERKTSDMRALVEQHGCGDCPSVVQAQVIDLVLRQRAWVTGLSSVLTVNPPDEKAFYTSQIVNVIYAPNSTMDQFIESNYANTSAYASKYCDTDAQLCIFIMPPNK